MFGFWFAGATRGGPLATGSTGLAIALAAAALAQVPPPGTTPPPPPPTAQRAQPPGGPGGTGGQLEGFRGRGEDGPGGRGFGGGFGGMPGMGEVFQPDFSPRDERLMTNELKLDDIQKLIVQTLLEDYQTAFRQGAEDLRAKFQQSGGLLGRGGRGPGANPAEETTRRQVREVMRLRFQALREEMEKTRQQGDQVTDEQLRQKFREQADALRAEFAAAYPEPPQREDVQKLMGTMAEQIDHWRARKMQLRGQLLMDVQNQLTDDQTNLWPAFERKLRREKTLRDGQLSGESLDLFRIVAGLKPDQALREKLEPMLIENEMPLDFASDLGLDAALRAKADPILADYDLALDSALKQRNDAIEQSQRELFEAFQKVDGEKGVAVIQRQLRYRQAVRDVNLGYAETLASVMPEELAAALRREVAERAFSRVFQPTQTQRLFRAAREMDGIDAGKLAAIDATERNYLSELQGSSSRLMQIIRQHEPQQQVQRAQQMAARITGVEPPQASDPIGEEFDKRRDLGRRYEQQLQSILTPEQYESLRQSAREAGRNDRRGRGGDDRPPREGQRRMDRDGSERLNP